MKISIIRKQLRVVSLVLLTALACSFGSSPTATFKGFIEAQKNKDVAGMKKRLSKRSLVMVENAALAESKTIDQILANDYPAAQAQKAPEMRNEKVTGDSGTLEVKYDGVKEWQTMYFVKADGDWKIAFDKTLDEQIERLKKAKS
ncbi:MAG TPA: hypothetical protein VN476_07880 [Pyrinomonadaceae bacterium]|nr:hypothetical protein [Pyrinomonadaceae bacterium]